MELKIRWQVEDGYMGKSRPQKTIFNTNDYMDDEDWDALSEEEKKELIDEAVQEDFENKISYCIDDYDL